MLRSSVPECEDVTTVSVAVLENDELTLLYDELKLIVCAMSLQKVLLSLRTYDIPSVTKTSAFELNARGCLPTVGDIEVTAVPLLSADPDVCPIFDSCPNNHQSHIKEALAC